MRSQNYTQFATVQNLEINNDETCDEFVTLLSDDYFDIDDDNDNVGEVNELWFSAKVQGKEVKFCIDSGASRVIMKSEQYLSIPDYKRPKLMSKDVVLKQADGTKVQIDGVAYMSVQIGTCKLQIAVLVAPVSDNLLGLNFCERHLHKLILIYCSC